MTEKDVGEECFVPPTPFFEKKLEVRFSETDAWGIVHHRHFFSWFEVARTDALAALGIPHKYWLQADPKPLLVEARCRILAPLTVGDQVVIAVSLQALRSRSLHFHYRVFKAEQTCAEGETQHLFATAAGRATHIPKELAARLRAIAP